MIRKYCIIGIMCRIGRLGSKAEDIVSIGRWMGSGSRMRKCCITGML